jgi:hypothetical protein
MEKQRFDLLVSVFKKSDSLQNIRKAEGALKDIFPDMPKLANTLLLALKIGALKELESNDNNLPVEVVLPKIARKLTDNYGTKEEDAMEAVGIWAIVSERATEDEVSTISRRFSSSLSGGLNAGSSNARLSDTAASRVYNNKDDNTRECPFCAENIKKKARICRYCKSNVEMMECPFCAEEIIKSSKACEFCSTPFGQISPLSDQDVGRLKGLGQVLEYDDDDYYDIEDPVVYENDETYDTNYNSDTVDENIVDTNEGSGCWSFVGWIFLLMFIGGIISNC